MYMHVHVYMYAHLMCICMYVCTYLCVMGIGKVCILGDSVDKVNSRVNHFT